MLGESSKAAHDRAKKKFEELAFEIGKESIRDYVARAKALVMKLEKNSPSTTKKTKKNIESWIAFPPTSMLKRTCF